MSDVSNWYAPLFRKRGFLYPFINGLLFPTFAKGDSGGLLKISFSFQLLYERSRIIQYSRSAGALSNQVDYAVTLSLSCSLQGDMHAGSRRKGNQHFEAKFFPFASNQI